jgi:hypothetical protein
MSSRSRYIRHDGSGAVRSACLIALLIVAACGDDDGGGQPKPVPNPVPFAGEMTMPDGWQGIWELNFDLKDADTGQLLTNAVWYDTLCPGDSLSVTFGPMMTDCNGYVRGDSLVFEAGEGWSEGPCDIEFVFELQAERSGDVITGAGEWRIETSGICGLGDAIAGRELIELEGTRVADVPVGRCR